jgi:predicted nucleotidyltransferase
MPDPINELLRELKSGLLDVYGPRLEGLYLYGSYARGDEQPESDVDVVIVLNRIENYGFEIDRTSELISSLSLTFGVTVSRLFVSGSDWQYRDTPFLATAREDAIPA